jgi:cytochrome bd ubiquinol oxidase subunit I
LSTLALARLLFAVTAGTHFLFVSLTLGLAAMVAGMETRAVFGDSDVHRRMVRYWGRLYVINYAVGIVSGLLMEFQFGLNWPGLTDHARDVFGAPLAMETLVAFFVESTFLGLWIFGRDRVNKYAHLALIWIVTLTAYASAYFILVANGFLKNPVGYVRVGDDLRLDSATALFTNPAALLPLLHITAGAFLVAGFFVAGVSGRHLKRSDDPEFFTPSLRIGLRAIVVAIVPAIVFGIPQFTYRQKPSPHSVLGDLSLEVMMFAWLAMFVIAIVALVKLVFRRHRGPIFFPVLLWSLALPYAAMLGGWIYREDGRRPWLIQGVLRIDEAVRPIGHAPLVAVTAGITALYAALVVANFLLLRRYARRGPDDATLGLAEDLEPVPTF